MISTAKTKFCKSCQTDKNSSCFFKSKKEKDGLQCKCKDCKKAYESIPEVKTRMTESQKRSKSKPEQKEKNRVKCREYKKANKEKINQSNTLYVSERKKNDPLFRFKAQCRSRLRKFLKKNNFSKRARFSTLLGCTLEELVFHIEQQFKPGMTWENYGYRGWHLDHIVPLATASTTEDVEKLSHYTNLQPLWGEDNMKKNKKNG